MVHHNACPNLDLRYLDSCSDKVRCSIRHAAHSMGIGIVLKLRKAFSEVGRRELYDPLATEGDPTNLTLVHEYINFKHLDQGESGVFIYIFSSFSTFKFKFSHISLQHNTGTWGFQLCVQSSRCSPPSNIFPRFVIRDIS